MSITSADIHKAICATWLNKGLDTAFKQLWNESDKSNYLTLNEGEAAPGTPQPYCVWEEGETGLVVRRSSRSVKTKNIERDVPFRFSIHSDKLTGDERSSKVIAATLAEDVMRIFGGHPTATPATFDLDYGGILNFQYQNDFGVRTGDENYMWVIDYIVKTDAPIRIG